MRTVHNLSVSGPGEVRALTETEVCKFCHVPHNAVVPEPLWGHALSRVPSYAVPELRRGRVVVPAPQPDGASRLCLSCHDGTVALGDLGPRRRVVPMAGAQRLERGRRGLHRHRPEWQPPRLVRRPGRRSRGRGHGAGPGLETARPGAVGSAASPSTPRARCSAPRATTPTRTATTGRVVCPASGTAPRWTRSVSHATSCAEPGRRRARGASLPLSRLRRRSP